MNRMYVTFLVCLMLLAPFRTYGRLPQRENSASAIISGKVFALTDLIPARRAEVYLLFYNSTMPSQTPANGRVATAGTVFEKFLCGRRPFTFDKEKINVSTTSDYCAPSIFAYGAFIRALTMATYWARGNPSDPSMCCFLREDVPMQGNNAPQQVLETKTDDKGMFRLVTTVPGSYVVVIRGEAFSDIDILGHPKSFWLETQYIEMGREYFLTISSPVSQA